MLSELMGEGSGSLSHPLVAMACRREFTKKEAVKVADSITRKMPQVEDEVQRIKLAEVVHQLESFSDLTKMKNSHLTALMIGYELDSQLDSFQTHD